MGVDRCWCVDVSATIKSLTHERKEPNLSLQRSARGDHEKSRTTSKTDMWLKGSNQSDTREAKRIQQKRRREEKLTTESVEPYMWNASFIQVEPGKPPNFRHSQARRKIWQFHRWIQQTGTLEGKKNLTHAHNEMTRMFANASGEND